MGPKTISPRGYAPVPRPVAPAVPVPASPNLVAQVGFVVMLGYVFLSFSRILDVTIQGLRLPIALFALMMVCVLLGGNITRIFRSPVTLALIAMFVWVMITVPFSTWKSGSMEQVVDTTRSCGLAIALTTLTLTTRQNFRLIGVFAFATTAAAALGLLFGAQQEARLVLPQGTYRDPNIYGVALLLGIATWLVLIRRSPITRLAVLACIGLNFTAFLLAGSRGAALGMCVLIVMLLFQLRGAVKKTVVFSAVLLALLIGYFSLPSYLQKRYMTVFTSAETTDAVEAGRLATADVGSSLARWRLLFDSFRMALHYPIFGVGPGQFAYQNWHLYKKRGIAVHGSEAHNTYGQMASETGFPGLLCYLMVIGTSLYASLKVVRLQKSPEYRIPPEVAHAGAILFVTMAVFAACSFFLSLAYAPLTYFIPALVGACSQSVRDQLPLWRIPAASAPAPPAPAVAAPGWQAPLRASAPRPRRPNAFHRQ